MSKYFKNIKSLDTDQYGHFKDIKMSDIKAIKYKNKVLYTA